MATSGTIYGSCTGGNGGKYDFWASWVRNSYSVDNGTSNITVSLKVQRNDGYSAAAHNLDAKPSVSLKVNGASKTPTTYIIDTRNSKVSTFATWTGNVTHGDDGSLTCPIVASFSLTGVSSLTGGSLSGNAKLDDIPRASTVSVSGTAKMGSAITISISRKSTSFTHDLTYTFGSASGSIKNGVTTSLSWTIPDLASYCNNDTKGTMVITCTTKNGTKTIGTDKVSFQVGVPAATIPTLSKTSVTMGESLRISVTGKGADNFRHKIFYTIGSKSLVSIHSSVASYIDWNVPTSLASETGNKTSAACTITCETYNGTALVGKTTKSVTLNTPAASSFTIDKTSLNFGGTINISISRDAVAYTHDLTYSLTPKGASTAVATGTIATGIDATKSWKVEDDLAKKMPAATEGTLTVTCTTKFKNSTSIVGTSQKTVTVTVPNNTTFQPKISSVALTCVSDLTGVFEGLYIAGKTKVKVKTTAVSDYSTIKSISVNVEGRNYTGADITSNFLISPGQCKIIVTVTDARGYLSVSEQSITVIDYASPRLVPVEGESAILCKRCTSNGTPFVSGEYLLIKAQRSYSKVISEVQKNFCRLQYRYKTSFSDSFSEWVDLLGVSDTTDSFSGKVNGIVLSIRSSYVFEIRAVDDIEEDPVPLSFKIATAFVTVHLGKGGRRIAIGKVAEEENLFDVALDTRFEGNVRGRVLGLGKLPELKTGDNADALIDPGAYAVKTTATAQGILNLPVPYAGVFRVMSANGTGNTTGNWVYITQEYLPLGVSTVYRRALDTDGTGTWRVGDWYKFTGTIVT